MKLSKSGAKGKILANERKATPATPIYSLKAELNGGKVLSLEDYKNKKIMLVNTASNCGYTGQFEELQELHEQYKEKLLIVGFPANDFQEQEKGNDSEIEQFCKINYGVTFPIVKKSQVVKGNNQNKVYQWLTNPKNNGWNEHQPDWNFSKYLIDENGTLTHYFGPSVSPLADEIKKAIDKR